MCGSGGGAPKDPYKASLVRYGGRGTGSGYDRLFVVDKEATAERLKNYKGGGRGALGRDRFNVYEKDEFGRNKLKEGYGYFDDNGKEVNSQFSPNGRNKARIWRLGKNSSDGKRNVRPGDQRGGTASEKPVQVSAANRRGKRLDGKSNLGMRSGKGLGGTILTGVHGLGGSAKTNKTLLGG